MHTDFDVIVVGAGLAGLTAAATVANGAASVVALDAHHPGGRAQSDERHGFVFNRGIHAFFRGGPGAAALADLGITPHGRRPPLEDYVMLAEGARHALPLNPAGMAASTYLDGLDKAQLGDVFGRMPALHADELADISLESWLARLELRPRVDALLRALFRLSAYASDFSSLSADAAIAHQQVAARSGVLYLDGGWAQLVGALRERVEVRTATPVSHVTGDGAGGGVEVHSATERLTARAAIIAVGGPQSTAALLPADPGWGDLGQPVTAACLDVGVHRVPSPGYVVSLDEPLYGTTQSPPARQAPDGGAVVGVIRYGARSADLDRPQLEAHLREVGVGDDDIATSRMLARMVVSTTSPHPANGGLPGRPRVTSTGVPGVFIAGDWIGANGLLADAAIASGGEAGRAALRHHERARVRVESPLR